MARTRLKCPEWLDDEARAEWTELNSTRDFSSHELPTLAAYCFTHSLWRHLRSAHESLGPKNEMSWTAVDGSTRPHPIVAIEAFLAAELRELTEALDLDQLGRRFGRSTRIMFLDEGADPTDE